MEHLMNASKERIDETCSWMSLKNLPSTRITTWRMQQKKVGDESRLVDTNI